MNQYVNAISGRLSLRPPQRDSLQILDRVMETTSLRREADLEQTLQVIHSEFPTVTDFERDFPSLCFALATGVGKTRLMGAFISYLYLAHNLRNFFVLAPNLTVYNKLITDFTPNTPKYVFKGIAEFVTVPPRLITGENYDSALAAPTSLLANYDDTLTVNIFNISKINSEVRGGHTPRIKRLSEYIGDSYFDYLARLPDLVLLMDESHRYRASAGVRAINELKPIIGLELTATPFLETSRGPVPFRNVIYDYPLARALRDGYVKEPVVVTQKNFQPLDHSRDELETIKLEDGIRLHETIKIELETFALQTGSKVVKPFVLVIARDTIHAANILNLVQSDRFFEGRYRSKVLQVDSTTKEDEVVERLLRVESPEEPTEIVIHVNMLKEGWDVTNLYTIIPLRAANARVLIEQSIGRGLRLPYGKRTGVKAIDRLNIVAHDKFQEIVDEANRPDSAIRLEQVILDAPERQHRIKTVLSVPYINRLIDSSSQEGSSPSNGDKFAESSMTSQAQKKIAQLAYKAIQRREDLPTSAYLRNPSILNEIVREVEEDYVPQIQPELEGLEVIGLPTIAAIVEQVIKHVQEETIDIPKIILVPQAASVSGFTPFKLDLSRIYFQPVNKALLIQSLQTNQQTDLYFYDSDNHEDRLEDIIVQELAIYPDIFYDEQSDLLYDLSSQVVNHLYSYLADEKEVRNVLSYYRSQLAALIHTQLQAHRWEQENEYQVKVTRGFTTLKGSAFTTLVDQPAQDFRVPPHDKSKIAQIPFVGFQRCLYPVQKFQSDPERRLALILDRETTKWFKPALGQFDLYYRSGLSQKDYQPDFVAETDKCIYMIEVKARNELKSLEVLAKQKSAEEWCKHATSHSTAHGGKPWQYCVIPDDVIADNMSLEILISSNPSSIKETE